VLDHETVSTAVGRVLTAGSWATQAPCPVNPSYQSPRAVDVLRRATADARYDELRAGSQVVVRAVVAGGRLPPDWVRVDADGTVTAIPAPDGTGPAFGLDAARLPVRLAESCDPADRAMATRLRWALVNRPDPAVGVSALDGRPLVDWRHPLALIAGAAAAIDDPAAAGTLLDQADDLHREHASYYGAAWAALGRLMLTTSRLGGCAHVDPVGSRSCRG
jgi:endoglucanase